MSSDVFPVDIMVDTAILSRWGNEGLPPDELCKQNAAILLHATRWPLLIDPHNQCASWLEAGTRTSFMQENMFTQGNTSDQRNEMKTRHPPKELVVLRMDQDNWLERLIAAVSTGNTVIIWLFQESIHESCFDELISQMISKRGKSNFVYVGENEIEINPSFGLILYTQVSNPHFKPKVLSQTVVVNFSITDEGIYERLLQAVISRELPDLFQINTIITEKENNLVSELAEVENEILSTLGFIEGELLSNALLIEQLQQKKSNALLLCEELQAARSSRKAFAKECIIYHQISEQAAIIFFLVESLWMLDKNYRFSIDLFESAFCNGLEFATVSTEVTETKSCSFEQSLLENYCDREVPEKFSDVTISNDQDRPKLGDMHDSAGKSERRILALKERTRFSLFAFAGQSLSKEHKLVFGIELSIRLSVQYGNLHPDYVEYILKGGSLDSAANPMSDWLTDAVWGSILVLERLNSFKTHQDGYKES